MLGQSAQTGRPVPWHVEEIVVKHRTRPGLAVLGTVLAALTGLLAAPAASASPAPVSGATKHGDGQRLEFAVFGDFPYTPEQYANFPKVVDQFNADRGLDFVAHLGDIKSGSTTCDDAYFASIKAQFDRVNAPLIYTVGDNEWTDCHRPNNGGYDPLERLAKVREVFFPNPGLTLGRHPMRVRSQDELGLPENVSFERAGVAFAALHVVGSNNSLAPWTGKTAPTPQQTVEVLGRTAGVLQEIHGAFARARAERARAVVLFQQADMFDPTVASPSFSDYFAFTPIVQAIARESARFRGQVYLFDGDSHVYNVDHPLAQNSSWLAFYSARPVTNLTRITVNGSTNAVDYLRVTVNRNRGGDVLSWVRVPFAYLAPTGTARPAGALASAGAGR